MIAVLGEPVLEVVAYGTPGPQGSKKAYRRKGSTKITLVESSKKVKPWRDAVAEAARAAARAASAPLSGPLIGSMVFSLARPKRLPRWRGPLPWVRPDLSKLLRATEDALDTDAGVIADDAHIVEYGRLAKVYAGDPDDPDALEQPGAVIRLWLSPRHLEGRELVSAASVSPS
ncbi:hypothetical protein ACFCZ3_19795 [Cellulosimicrobium cellulans]|uniref:hypothetical protein n=1 Tax=Cellulosimicrobium cellulans TaxID=1710 RepID=UPI0035DD75BF